VNGAHPSHAAAASSLAHNIDLAQSHRRIDFKRCSFDARAEAAKLSPIVTKDFPFSAPLPSRRKVSFSAHGTGTGTLGRLAK